MRSSRVHAPPSVSQSEHGFLALAGREAALSPREAAIVFRDLVSADMDWADDRKRRNRRNAAVVRIAGLVLTALSTIVLGIAVIPARAYIALPMVTIVTVLGALDSYFNWRALWVLLEEARYRLNRVRDHMDFYLVTTPGEQITVDRLREFFDEQQQIWSDVSRQWVGFRKLNRSLPPDHTIEPSDNR